MKYNFHHDAGHAWLEVERKELKELGIASRISSYSYWEGDTVYLEEDLDAYAFLDAKEAHGQKLTAKDIQEVNDGDHSFIRSLNSYQRTVNDYPNVHIVKVA